jgi:hypothetical protein
LQEEQQRYAYYCQPLIIVFIFTEDPKFNAINDSIVRFIQFLFLRHDEKLDGTADVTKAQKKFETDIKNAKKITCSACIIKEVCENVDKKMIIDY